jgi:hypothetical protein
MANKTELALELQLLPLPRSGFVKSALQDSFVAKRPNANSMLLKLRDDFQRLKLCELAGAMQRKIRGISCAHNHTYMW